MTCQLCHHPAAKHAPRTELNAHRPCLVPLCRCDRLVLSLVQQPAVDVQTVADVAALKRHTAVGLQQRGPEMATLEDTTTGGW